MLSGQVPKSNRPFDVAIVTPKAPWCIKSATITGRWTIRVVFNDGTEGDIDLEAFVAAPTAGVFKALRDPEVFNAVKLVFGALTWPGELDLAPDAMYDVIKETGRYVP